MLTVQELTLEKQKLHKKHCDNCVMFLIGQCGGIQYHYEGVIDQPLCPKVKKAYEQLKGK